VKPPLGRALEMRRQIARARRFGEFAAGDRRFAAAVPAQRCELEPAAQHRPRARVSEVRQAALVGGPVFRRDDRLRQQPAEDRLGWPAEDRSRLGGSARHPAVEVHGDDRGQGMRHDEPGPLFALAERLLHARDLRHRGRSTLSCRVSLQGMFLSHTTLQSGFGGMSVWEGFPSGS
jgi:hypothetical protein